MRQFIAEGLASEHRVACASDGAEGLELARTLVPDAIVTDVMMPKLGGDAMVRAIRADPALADIPIIVLTAKADDALRVTLLRQGAQDYIMKPFALDELRARLANLLTMKRARDLLRQQLQSESSDLAELAAQMAERDRQLTTAVESLAVARDQAERASQAKTRFLGLVSHELRTPLTVLHLQLERLRVDPPDNPQHRDIVRRMALSTARLRDLIESLLHSARVESGRLSTTIELVDLARLCADVVEEMRPFAEHRRLALSLSVDPALPAARTDARLVRLVLVNLCANAIKFTDKGSVEVTACAVGDELHLAVKDSGPGIAECDRLRIFEPFRQLEDIVHKHTPGVGLGLAISQQIAAALGGRIELDSTVGEGSTFRLVMPRGSD
jgi:signal transduction histidine kinase